MFEKYDTLKTMKIHFEQILSIEYQVLRPFKDVNTLRICFGGIFMILKYVFIRFYVFNCLS